MKPLRFTVDAALLRELGERLIGQPHIALAELAKNSYDADATTCRITFGDDTIVVLDDGHGMSFQEFCDFWMRIGTTHKLDQRQSRKFNRPLTGSKGVGRLAVQFLASKLTIETASEADPSRILSASVDWRQIESGRELTSVEVPWNRRPIKDIFPEHSATGTRITLTGLKNVWDASAIENLGDQLWSLRSPFRLRSRKTIDRGPTDFEVEIDAPAIEGAKEAFDARLDALFGNWKARISGRLDAGRSGTRAAITVEFKAGYPEGLGKENNKFSVNMPVGRKERDDDNRALIDKIEFEILVFRLEGKQAGGILVEELRNYLGEFGNVSIYDSGFRLPYYGMEHDWLDIAADQTKRLSVSELLPRSLKVDGRYMLDLPDPRRLFGAVGISTPHERRVAAAQGAGPGEWLQIQAGRDRLHDNPAYGQLRDLVRFGLHYYANRYRARVARAIEVRRHKEPASAKQERAIDVLDRHQKAMPVGVYREVRREVKEALDASRAEEAVLDSRAALLAPLASAGMIALSLNHELAREARLLKRSISELRRFAQVMGVPELKALADELSDASIRLSALQDLFAPLLSEEDKAAVDRLRIRPIAEHVTRAMRTIMPGVAFDLTGIPNELRFPLGSFAEWNAVLQNVLTNAWNALLSAKERVIAFKGGQSAYSLEYLHISDTGQGLGVPLEDAPKLFEPFERQLEPAADLQSLVIGGQGLGLSIVRMIARRRNADVRFVVPEPGFSTTLELTWKG